MHRRDLLLTLSASALAAASPIRLHATGGTSALTKRSTMIDGEKINYVDEGSGRPVVFLHGNPTSSYLWRNIIPGVLPGHRAIAPDLIGMGDSGKPDIAYTYGDHARYLHGFLDTLDLRDVTLVLHDWGSALGFDWAERNRDRVRAIAFMEAIVPPAMPFPSLEAMAPFDDLFRNLRTTGIGEAMVLEQNFFVEEVLGRMGVVTPLDEATLAVYRAPFPTPESRRPTLQWPREIPIGGHPAETDAVVRRYSTWLTETDIPKLLFHVAPGALIPPPAVDWLKSNLTNLETLFLGPGSHFIQEDYPDEIARGLGQWLAQLS